MQHIEIWCEHIVYSMNTKTMKRTHILERSLTILVLYCTFTTIEAQYANI